MKQALSALELRMLTKELDSLIGAKISQIYDQGKDDLLLQLHHTGVGKEIVRIRPPFALYKGSEKPMMEGGRSGFCSLLRQKVSNSNILAQSQHGFDRIWVASLGHLVPEAYLIVEFFGKGNIILTDDKLMVIGAVEERSFGIRSTKKQALYQFPTQPINPFNLDDKAFFDVLSSSNKNQLVKAFALDMSLGGLYAEELCLRAGVEKSSSPSDITLESIKKIIASLKSFEVVKPQVVFKDFAPHDCVAADLVVYEGLEKKYFDSFSDAQAFFWSAYMPPKKLNPRRQKLETIIADQKRHFDALSTESVESQKKGELIYLHYPIVKEVLRVVKESGKTIGWKEAKRRLNNHPLVKDIDEKKGEVELELQ
ncbi:MAG: NFACT family protein [Nanoarchaeota archaeon]